MRLSFWSVVRESAAAAVAQRVASIVTVVMIAGMCAAVLLTTGRTVGAETAVLRSIDSVASRAIIVRANDDAGLDSTVLDRIAHIDGISWSAAFGTALDGTNTVIPGGKPVATRAVWGSALAEIGIGHPLAPGRIGWASELASDQLGMLDGVGSVQVVGGGDVAIVGRLTVPDFLTILEPAVFVPGSHDEPGPVTVLVVVAERPDLIAPCTKSVLSVLAVDDPTKVTVETSAALARLRAAIQGDLAQFGRSLILLIFGLTGALVAAILFGLVMLRRKDFGRRRALGATRGLIVGIVLIQTALPAAAGAVLGSTAGLVALRQLDDPAPPPGFVVSIAALAVGLATLAALVPALAAAFREPIRELRTP